MKDQINRYARGVFEYDALQIESRENSIYAVVDINRGYNGSFVLYERKERNIKGIVSTDNDKVVIANSTFAGGHVTISFGVRVKGATSGDVIEGSFEIVSNGGQLSIPYSFRIEAGSYDSSAGSVRNLFNFATLAQNYPEEAIKLFEAEDFEDVFLGEDLALRCIYEGLIKGNDSRYNIEEFLIATHKKSPINISISNNSVTYDNARESFKDSVIIERDNWGFANVTVTASADFIKLERNTIDAALFAGNRYEFAYIIDFEQLHDGNNFGAINFECAGKILTYYINVSRKPTNGARANSHMLKRLSVDLMTLYVRFRTHKINISDWIRESQIVIEKAREIDENAHFYRLALAQTYIAAGKDEQAKEIIENIKDEITKDNIDDYPIYCYFLYINTLYNKDRAYSKKVSAIVKELYRENDDWRILWVLLFMDEEMEENKSLKLLRIKEQFNLGCKSPAMYIEACNILNENPHLLRVLNSFEISALIFGADNGMIDGKLASIVSSMMVNLKNCGRNHIRLLMALYAMDEDEEVLECLCKLMIRNSCTGSKYLKYYGEGIERELKVTRLFEYYIESRDENDMSPLPKMLLMYFSYNNSLDYRRKAYLYANIIHNKVDNAQMYKTYLPHIELYASEQLLAGHVNENLAYIYNNIVTPAMINEDNANPASEIYYTQLVTCNNRKYNSIIVRHKESNSEKEYPLVDGKAFVKIYTEAATIFFLDNNRRRYCQSVVYEINRLFEDESIIRQCIIKDNSLIHTKMADCENYIRYPKKDSESVDSLIIMSKAPNMSPFYRKKLTAAVIDYYYDSYDPDGFETFITGVNCDELDENSLTKIIEINIIKGNYRYAYDLYKKYFAIHVSSKRLAKMCSVLCEMEEFEDNELLTKLSHSCFVLGRYDENTLMYLVRFYNGITDNMTQLWAAARGMGIDTYELEERIIILMLFSHSVGEDIYDIFEDYYAKGPNERIVEAYLAYQSYAYFVREEHISPRVFELMETTLENEKDLPVVCKLALTKYYATLEELTYFRKDIAQNLVLELAHKNYVFPYFTKLAKFICIPFSVSDKTMVEYHADPRHRVVIHYTLDNGNNVKNYVAEDMKNIFEGIFVKQFVLFYGESVSYYISEEVEDGELITDTVVCSNNNDSMEAVPGRFAMINDIIESRNAHDNETYRKLVHTYAVTDTVANQVFKPL